MAERTKFSAYCIYSGVISLVIYPIEAHWIWGGGWLSQRGFHDYAGSCAIHMVGGIAALVGAIFLGPRIGKYVKDKAGKVIKVNAIPGHSITLGALGVFILWLGWYGFNGAAATSAPELASVFLTTTIAPSVATCVTMIFTWIKNGKPDVSMCLNASLAGLVGITAGCDALDAIGAAVVGVVSGILVVVVVELLDIKLHIDDPVGAVGVHMANGIWVQSRSDCWPIRCARRIGGAVLYRFFQAAWASMSWSNQRWSICCCNDDNYLCRNQKATRSSCFCRR